MQQWSKQSTRKKSFKKNQILIEIETKKWTTLFSLNSNAFKTTILIICRNIIKIKLFPKNQLVSNSLWIIWLDWPHLFFSVSNRYIYIYIYIYLLLFDRTDGLRIQLLGGLKTRHVRSWRQCAGNWRSTHPGRCIKTGVSHIEIRHSGRIINEIHGRFWRLLTLWYKNFVEGIKYIIYDV